MAATSFRIAATLLRIAANLTRLSGRKVMNSCGLPSTPLEEKEAATKRKQTSCCYFIFLCGKKWQRFVVDGFVQGGTALAAGSDSKYQ
jgi:hypothetical protein